MAYNIYEVKMSKLLKMKVEIQELQEEQSRKQKLRESSSKRIRELGQLISEKRKVLMEEIRL